VYAFGTGGGSLQVVGDFTKLGKPDKLGQGTQPPAGLWTAQLSTR
jgi:hypothetical protein